VKRKKPAATAEQRILSRLVRFRVPTGVEREELQDVLNDATDEAPLQKFLADHPNFLIRLLPPGSKIVLYDRPRLGSEYIPDFLISVQNSQGSHWTSIELESPTVRPVSKAGEMSRLLSHAIGQIHDWRDWLSDNVAYAREQLKLKGISGEVSPWIILGRRTAMTDRQQKRYAALNRLGITVLSYDRLLDV
jgi:hypothetical protein